MSGRLFTDLTGLPPQFEVRSESEKWQGAFKAAQGCIREQGQVMSAALTNNRSLWETNKVLRQKVADLTTTCQRLEHERGEFKRALEAIPQDVQERAALQEENNLLRIGIEAIRKELAGSLFPELDTDARREALERVRAQEAELQATGLVPTADDIARRDHARDAQQGPFQLDPAALRAT